MTELTGALKTIEEALEDLKLWFDGPDQDVHSTYLSLGEVLFGHHHTILKALDLADRLQSELPVLENGTATIDGVDLTLEEMFEDIKNLVEIYVEPNEKLSGYYYGIIITLNNILKSYLNTTKGMSAQMIKETK